jgi:hypothetical protein
MNLQNRDLHPTDEGLSVGTPGAWGARAMQLDGGHARWMPRISSMVSMAYYREVRMGTRLASPLNRRQVVRATGWEI